MYMTIYRMYGVSMSTVPKTLSLDVNAVAAGEAAARAAGMSLSAYTSRALRKQATTDNLRRAAAALADVSDGDRAALATVRAARAARIAATGAAA
jgi:hypothetical protein